jgi:hypothetical protein
MEVHKMKIMKYSPVLLLLLSGLFFTGCYTSLATRSHGDKYPDNTAYNDDNSNANNDSYTNNNDSYTDQDTMYNDDQGDLNINDGPYPYYGRFYTHYYPSVAIGFGVGHFYDPFYWDPFYYDGWCAPYFYAYDPFFYYPFWGIGYGGGFHHGHGWYNSGFKTRTRDGFALRNSGFRNSSNGVRGTLTNGTGIYSRNSDRSRLVRNNGITTTRNPIIRTNVTSRNNAPNIRNRNDIVSPRTQNPNIRNRNDVINPRTQNPNIRNRNYLGNRQNPNIRNNRNGNRTYSNGNRPPQRTYNSPPQRNSAPSHNGGGSNRSNGSSNRGGGGSNRSSGGGGHSRR